MVDPSTSAVFRLQAPTVALLEVNSEEATTDLAELEPIPTSRPLKNILGAI
jgi:hypothetical protein